MAQDQGRHPPAPERPPLPGAPHADLEPPKLVDDSLPMLSESQFDLVLDPNQTEAGVRPLPPIPKSRLVDRTEPRDFDDDGPEPDMDLDQPSKVPLFLSIAAMACIGASGYYAFTIALPDHQAKVVAEAKVTVAERELANLKAEHITATATLETLNGEKTQLTSKLAEVEAKLSEAKKVSDAEMERALTLVPVRAELEKTLKNEIKRGDVRVADDPAGISIVIAEKTLFANNSVELSDKGKELLKRLAVALNVRPDQPLAFIGHTDEAAPTGALAERYPSTWALSAAWADRVARFVVTDGALSGKRVSAVGRAEFRPFADPKTATGKKWNRRIELLVSPPVTVTPAVAEAK